MAHHIDARYDEEDGTLVPPLRTLGFNPKLKMNDSLLVQSYIEAYDISYPEALRRIESEVEELRSHLETSGEYELNDIGVLRLNDEGNIEFTPCEAGILTPELYGLGAVEMPRLDTLMNTEATLVEEDESKKLKPAEPEDGTIVIKMSWLRNAVAVAAALLAFLMIGTPVSNSNKMTDRQQSSFISVSSHSKHNPIEADAMATPAVAEESLEPVPQIETTINVEAQADEAIEGTADETVANKGKADGDNEGKAAEKKQPVHATETKAAAHTYALVLASQVTKQGAERFIKQLKGQGYSNVRMTISGKKKIRRVIYGSFATEAEAAAQQRKLRTQSAIFRDSWVLKVKE